MFKQSMSNRLFYDWNNWFIAAKHKESGITHYLEKTDEFTDGIITTNKDQYNIYLITLVNNLDLYQSSALIDFNEDNMTVKTKNGSLYNLKKPVNDEQLTNLKKYFSKE